MSALGAVFYFASHQLSPTKPNRFAGRNEGGKKQRNVYPKPWRVYLNFALSCLPAFEQSPCPCVMCIVEQKFLQDITEASVGAAAVLSDVRLACRM